MKTALCIAAALFWVGCAHGPDPKAVQGAQIHYDLGVQAQKENRIHAAYREYKQALTLDDQFADAHFAMGLLLQGAYHRPSEAIAQYQKTLALDPTYTKAKVNLGTVYLNLHQYDQAISLFKEALNDMAYSTPYIAESDLGWALFEKGQVADAVDHIRSATTMNPKYCLGYRQLGDVYRAGKHTRRACEQYQRYLDHCPRVADAAYRVAVCQAKLGHPDKAKAALKTCVGSKEDGSVVDACRALLAEPATSSKPPEPGAAGAGE